MDSNCGRSRVVAFSKLTVPSYW